MDVNVMQLPDFRDDVHEYEYLQEEILKGAKKFFRAQMRCYYNPQNEFHRRVLMAFLCDHKGLLLRGYKRGGLLCAFTPFVPLLKKEDEVEKSSWAAECKSEARQLYLDALSDVIDGLRAPERTLLQLACDMLAEGCASKLDAVSELSKKCSHRIVI